jgi:UDP-N-acetylglucosamine 1-carboxyvinyltransferase
VTELRPMTHEVMADRIELGTYLVAAGITGGHLQLTHCQPAHVDAVMRALTLAGMRFDVQQQSVEAWGNAAIHSIDLQTWPYPGFPTDMQAQLMALMALGDGVSRITEQIFEKRFMHVSELRRLGADIEVDGQNARIRGVPKLSGAPVMATDLRASASLVLAGLAAEGTTEISRVYHLDRGYEAIEKKLEAVGARIKRVRE